MCSLEGENPQTKLHRATTQKDLNVQQNPQILQTQVLFTIMMRNTGNCQECV
jgi:hypothetical protein